MAVQSPGRVRTFVLAANIPQGRGSRRAISQRRTPPSDSLVIGSLQIYVGSRIPIPDPVTSQRRTAVLGHSWFAQGRDTGCRTSGFSAKDYQPSSAAAAIVRKPTSCLNIIDCVIVSPVNPVDGRAPALSVMKLAYCNAKDDASHVLILTLARLRTYSTSHYVRMRFGQLF